MLHFNVWLLMVVGALAMCTAPIIVFCGSLVGQRLALDPALATLPVAMLVVGTASLVVPITLLMKRYGRRNIFIGGAWAGVIASGLAVFSLTIQSFWMFCLAVYFLGGCLAVVQQYRFAAMESVPTEWMPSAAARVLLGGLVAAFLGPEMALQFKNMLVAEFAGAFVLQGVFFMVAAILLLSYRPVEINGGGQATSTGRSLRIILCQPVLWAAICSAAVGYALMSFVMTATPLSMHSHDGHSLADTKWVIQSHIMAMFIPSLFSGWLMRRLGVGRMLVAGIVSYGFCIIVAYTGNTLIHYWLSLVLLGIGWNFLFVGGTSLLPSAYKSGEQFRVQSFNEFMVFGAQAVAALGSGWMMHQFGWQWLLMLCVPFLLVLGLVLLYWQWQERHAGVEPATDIR